MFVAMFICFERAAFLDVLIAQIFLIEIFIPHMIPREKHKFLYYLLGSSLALDFIWCILYMGHWWGDNSNGQATHSFDRADSFFKNFVDILIFVAIGMKILILY